MGNLNDEGGPAQEEATKSAKKAIGLSVGTALLLVMAAGVGTSTKTSSLRTNIDVPPQEHIPHPPREDEVIPSFPDGDGLNFLRKLHIDETICGDDDRVQSFFRNVGRLRGAGCTGFLIAEDVFVTAGHCCNPDRATDRELTLEFNVPLSNDDGSINSAAPEDVYDVTFRGCDNVKDSRTIPETPCDRNNAGIGNDWCVGNLLPNTETGLKAGDAQGCWVDLEFTAPPSNQGRVRITGHGIKRNPSNEFNRVQQTQVGPRRDVGGPRSPYQIRYQTDTEPASSGSPVLIPNLSQPNGGRSFGIHTNGGCTSDPPFGANSGMTNLQPQFIAALRRYLERDPRNQIPSPVCPDPNAR